MIHVWFGIFSAMWNFKQGFISKTSQAKWTFSPIYKAKQYDWNN